MHTLRSSFYRLRVSLPAGVDKRARLLTIMTRLHNFRVRYGHANQIGTVYNDAMMASISSPLLNPTLMEEASALEECSRRQCAADELDFDLFLAKGTLAHRYARRGTSMSVYAGGYSVDTDLEHLRACGFYDGDDGVLAFARDHKRIASSGTIETSAMKGPGYGVAREISRNAESDRVRSSALPLKRRAREIESVAATHTDAATLRLFGIDDAAATALGPHVDAAERMHMSSERAANALRPMAHTAAALLCHVNNTSVGSITDLLDNCVMNFFMHLVASASSGQIVAAEALLSHVLWRNGNVVTNAEVDNLSDALNMMHLDRPVVLFPWHIGDLGGHWILVILDHRTRTITVADPLGGNAADYHIVHRVRPAIQQWLARERERHPDHPVWAGFTPSGNYLIEAAVHLPTQNDGTSCGAFVLAYAYFFLFHGRLPTAADFTGANAPALRAMILDAIINGRLRTPLPPGGAHGARAAVGDTVASAPPLEGTTARITGAHVAIARPTLSNFAVDFDNIAAGYRWGRTRKAEAALRRRNRIIRAINNLRLANFAPSEVINLFDDAD